MIVHEAGAKLHVMLSYGGQWVNIPAGIWRKP